MINNWQKVKIQDVCKVASGATPRTAEPTYWNGGISWITPLDLSKINSKYIDKGIRSITRKGLESCSAELLPPNSLIISSRAPIGYFAINTKPTTTNQGCKTFICSNSVNVEFLYYYLSQHLDEIKRLGSGSTFAEVNKKHLENLIIKLPDIHIQKKISLLLDCVDNFITKTDQVINKTETLKQGLMKELFNKGIGHKKYKKSQFGSIPETWTVEKLNDQIKFKNGFAFSTKSYTDNGKTVLRMSNIGTDGRLNVNKDNVKFIPNGLYEELSDFMLRKNDLVIAMTDVTKELGIVGKTAIVDKDNTYILNQRVGRIRPNANLNVRFLHYFTNSTYWLEPIHKKVTGSAQFNLSTHDIREAQILVPPYNEQIKIVELLDNTDSKVLNEIVIKKRLINLKKGLMQDIFSQRVEIN